jgi:hypothetical protein
MPKRQDAVPSVLDRLTEAEQQRLIDVLAELLLSAVENLERAGIDPAAVARGDVTIRRRGSMLTVEGRGARDEGREVQGDPSSPLAPSPSPLDGEAS